MDRNIDMPTPVVDVTDAALSDELSTPISAAERAEDVQPGGYDPRWISEPPSRSKVAAELRWARIALRVGLLSDRHLDAILARAARALTGGVAVLALMAVALVATPAPKAAAAEGPQPDPAVLAPAVLTAALTPSTGAVRIPVVTVHATPTGWFCATAWGPRGYLARACASTPSFTIRIPVRYVPVSRTRVVVTDDVSPFTVTPALVVLDVRRASRFGLGTWIDLGRGQLFVSAPLQMYSPARGGWVVQQLAPVQVQERVAGRWLVRATLTTRSGRASGVVALGGGTHVVRVVRPAGATVWSTTGMPRVVQLTTEPLDVV